MVIKSYVLGMCQTNCYLLFDEVTKECVIIDPGCESALLDKEIEENELCVKYIVFTHGHFDHIGGLQHYISKYDTAIVSMHNSDVEAVMSEYDVFYVDMANKEYIMNSISLHNDGDVIEIGNVKLNIIHTPGHTNGGVCFYTEGVLFSGDTLFKKSIGRTDFIFGDFGIIEKSIRKLYELPEDTIVYPGHGESTTISEEKISNPFVRA